MVDSEISLGAPRHSPQSFTPSEAEELLDLIPKSLLHWKTKDIIRTSRTIGGHRKFYKEDVSIIRHTRIKIGLIEPYSGVKNENVPAEHRQAPRTAPCAVMPALRASDQRKGHPP